MSARAWVWLNNDQSQFLRGYVAEHLENGRCKVAIVGKDGAVESTVEVDQGSMESCNPPRFDMCNDMAELTHLNEPSVVYNLYLRYTKDSIYTYSGLFLVAVNPYKPLPIYDARGYRDNAPHIFATAEKAYTELTRGNQNQSILITGESGAGKTENTKRVIHYLSAKGATTGIDSKILQANPILESFGNAKTIKNNNSSRFGKFIKIYFDDQGGISGAHIDYYLLEKSRVVSQGLKERNYHVFYQFLSGYDKLDKLGLSKDGEYSYLAQTTHDGGFSSLMSAFDVVGFTSEEQELIFSCLAVVLHLGNLQFTSKTSEQASFTKDSPVGTIAALLGVSPASLSDAFLRPKVRAGRELVVKSQRADDVKFAIDAFARWVYEKLFQFIVGKINDSLNGSTGNFIGVLDIAGFEIFESNSFEQLCINYTNEKLQQFFNHHSFILEQKEYMREQIQWDYVDFGRDLQPTIDMIESRSPMGILKLLDEECMMPKSSDAMFMGKLSHHFNKKHPKFAENKYKSGFIVKHYAGDVEYNVDGWLQKNTDPLSESILQLMGESSNEYIRGMFHDENPLKTRNKLMKTASSKHRDQLGELMRQLDSTKPHFVRCILPNLDKIPGKFDRGLVVDQLRCNGVLEGIRITRAGYPNKLPFAEFVSRYAILGDASGQPERRQCESILKCLEPDLYKIGQTRIFFKSAVLGRLEAMRDARLGQIFTQLQRVIRGNATRKVVARESKQFHAARVVSKTMLRLEGLQGNPWMALFFHVKPYLAESVEKMETSRLDAVVADLQQSQSVVKEQESALAVLRAENKRHVSIISRLESEMQEKTGYETAVEKLTVELKGATQALDRVKKEHEAATGSLKRLAETEKQQKQKLAEAREKLTLSKSKLEKKSMENERLHSALGEMEAQLARLKSDYANLQEKHVTTNASLASKISQLETERSTEKENQPPDPQLMQEYAHIKLKMNEQSASLRKEKFENSKLREELLAVKQRALRSSELTPKRRSLALGQPRGGNVEALREEISNLQMRLEQEQSNAQRAESYAIDLQKQLNKTQTAPIVVEPPRETPTAFHGISPDFIQIYHDINKSLKASREELHTAKAEVLRLKSLLRESEEELYRVKQVGFQAAMDKHEEELARVRENNAVLESRNKELTSELSVYKTRSGEYFSKLELAESAVTLSKRHETAAKRDLDEAKSQLRLARDEARTSQSMLREARGEAEKLEKVQLELTRKVSAGEKVIADLRGQLEYHIGNYENRAATEKLKDEIQTLCQELHYKAETEATLKKENKKLQLDLDEVRGSRDELQNQLEEMSLKEEQLEQRLEEQTDTIRSLESAKIMNERRIGSLMKQLAGMKEILEENAREKSRLTEQKQTLEKELAKVSHELELSHTALAQSKTEAAFLKTHLENQRKEAQSMQSELALSKLSTSSDYKDQQRLRNDLLVAEGENYSLKKTNQELSVQVQDLQEKLFSNEQIKYLESRSNELSSALDSALQEKHDAETTVKSLTRQVAALQVRIDNESQLSKRYNDENFDYQNKINRYKSSIEVLHSENTEKELQLRLLQEKHNQLQETLLVMEKEKLSN
ncbi:uncharacterized protein LODBEIA_P56950 [Lodderomyces beijingensis]|uniref:Myosin motor domain-containing protein n=1 Tax=Lodderomyces beijingensis TaxID=1775926 RepID=A0ABP0ZI44_9ASCO